MFRLLSALLTFALMLALIAGGGFYWWITSPIDLVADSVDFTIPSGAGMRSAAREIAASGIDVDPRGLVVLARILKVETAIKAGSYEVRHGITPLELVRTLTRGNVSLVEIAFIEGWTFRQLREKLDAHVDIRHETMGLSDSEILQRIGATEPHPEGLFFPDTYLFARQERDISILVRAYRMMQRHLAREWELRDGGLPYASPYQALTMASIIEKETGRDADRTQIASVFVNRLRQGMLLQTDPTVIYGMGSSFDGNLRKRDLQTDTPYNTYTRTGLPPTPIALPGIASLRAALHPAPGQALYFVARGDGSSQFSNTLEEHNRAVARYQKGTKR